MDNILDIVYTYSKNYRLLDDVAIKKVMDLLISINNFDDLDYEIVSKKRLFFSKREQGNYVNNYITLFTNNIRKNIYNEKYVVFDDEKFLPLFQKKLGQNLEIIHTLFHEVEHALQDRQMKDFSDKTIESKLLRYEYNFTEEALENVIFYDIVDKIERYIPGKINYQKCKKLYKDNYDYSIMERLADGYSLNKIQNLLEMIKSEAKQLYELEKNIKLHYQMKSYIELDQLYPTDEKIYSPTIVFLYNLGYLSTSDEMYKLDDININELSYSDRFKYGFYLTQEEFDKNVATLDLLKK